jgi:hypothetical protein
MYARPAACLLCVSHYTLCHLAPLPLPFLLNYSFLNACPWKLFDGMDMDGVTGLFCCYISRNGINWCVMCIDVWRRRGVVKRRLAWLLFMQAVAITTVSYVFIYVAMLLLCLFWIGCYFLIHSSYYTFYSILCIIVLYYLSPLNSLAYCDVSTPRTTLYHTHFTW